MSQTMVRGLGFLCSDDFAARAVTSTPDGRLLSGLVRDLGVGSEAVGLQQTPLDLDAVSNLGVREQLSSWVRDDAHRGTLPPSVPDEHITHIRASIRPGRAQHITVALVAAALVIPLAAPPLRWIMRDGSVVVESPTDRSTDHLPTLAAETASFVQSPAGERDVVTMVEWVAGVLGLQPGPVLTASGIAHRSFYHWKDTGAQPRIKSQGDLWGLVQSVAGLVGILNISVSEWLKAEPSRLEALLAGQHRRLVVEAATDAATRGDYDDPDAIRRDARRRAVHLDPSPSSEG